LLALGPAQPSGTEIFTCRVALPAHKTIQEFHIKVRLLLQVEGRLS